MITLLLLIPIYLKINSIRGICQLEWKNIFCANVLLQNDEPVVRLKVFFWKKEFNLLQMATSSQQKKTKKKPSKPRRKMKFDFRKKLKRLRKAIRVNRFFLNIDTDDYLWNAYLYPVFFFLKKERRNVNINFQGDVEFILEIRSRPIQLLYAVLF